MTRRAMDFISEAETDGRPWCLHLSYIKPHWPYIAPEPYASMYSTDDMIPVIRSERERAQSASGVRRLYGHALLPQLGARRGAREGDPDLYGPDQPDRRPDGRADEVPGGTRPLGNHHDRVHLRSRRLSRRSLDGREGSVPRAVGEDPADRHRSRRSEADATRGTRSDALVEGIDLAPTFVDYFGGKAPAPHPRRPLAAAAAARADAGETGARSRSPNTTTPCRTCG